MNLPQFGILRLWTGEPDARRRERQPTRGRQPRKLFLFLSLLMPCALFAQEIPLAGRVVDPQGKALAGASVELMAQNRVLAEGKSDSEGEFHLSAPSAGQFMIKVDAPGFRTVMQPVTVTASGNSEIVVAVNQLASRVENVTVTANSIESVVLSPDPSGQVFAREELMSANPGQPGAPLAIPGYPIETASSGIKAPQYFAPGVAGDHGEPIAQFVAVGSYLVPNNLSANAHGNGYSDPNILIPEVLESVQVDGGAFDVREGNHSVNLAATYALEPQLQPFLAVTADYRDIEVVAGFAPSASSWIAFAGSYGNGFLDRLEHRQQYKFNGQRVFQAGAHRITLFAIAYYGSSYVPGLVPLFPGNAPDAGSPNLGDTIDPRQKDQTHTALAAVNDVWQLGPGQQFELSGFFRTYNLSLYSDFGQGLIRQSEFRTVAGGSANYVKRFRDALSLLAGFDYEREAPRRDNLDHYGFFDPANPGFYGPFTPVDSNNVTISPLTPYLAAGGALWKYFRYYLGWRRDEIDINNQDLLHPQNSFEKWVGVDSPKASVSFLPKESWFVPLLSFSYGGLSSRRTRGSGPEPLRALRWRCRIPISWWPARTSTKPTLSSLLAVSGAVPHWPNSIRTPACSLMKGPAVCGISPRRCVGISPTARFWQPFRRRTRGTSTRDNRRRRRRGPSSTCSERCKNFRCASRCRASSNMSAGNRWAQAACRT